MSRLLRPFHCLSTYRSISWKTTTCSPPSKRGRTRVHQPPDLFCGFLHCYYEDVYGTRPVTRELQNGLVWYYCGLNKPPSRDTIDRFLTDLEHVIDDVFNQLVEQAAVRGLLDVTYSIDSTHVEAIQPQRRSLVELRSNG